MSELLARLQKAGSVKHTSVLSKSKLLKDKDQIQTDVPIINAAMSGWLDGGLTSGLTFLAGPSKHFKSLLGLVLVKAYMKKYPDAVCLFFDSEFGITPEYITANGIDADRVLHIPIEHIENLKFDIVQRLEQIKRGDKVILFIDSVGNLASKKEVEDALNENSAADMTRARALKSLWRIVTPSLTIKDIPAVVVNHTYQTMEMFSKAVMSGGTGGMYSANQVLIIGKSQEKEKVDGKDQIVGWNFTINIEKSRFVKEKAKFTFTVKYDGGISKWSGLLELAEEFGYIEKCKLGNATAYAKIDQTTGEVSEKKYKTKETETSDFWIPIIADKNFGRMVNEKYAVSSAALISEEDTIADYPVEEDEGEE